jgi:caa(3)-type oxidase subunit IV
MSEDKNKHHHILSNSTSLWVFIFLLVFTVITVAIAQFDFGSLNFPVAMLIATAKAFAVVLFFMGMKYDANDNRAIFGSSFIFLFIFLGFTAMDLFSRGQIRVVGSPLMAVVSDKVFDKPWLPTEEIVAHGKAVYVEQACATCHGDEGLGNGPAGVALAARNFHEEAGWKNGRNPAQVFQTLTKGLNAMPAYSTISESDRWAVSHFLLTWGSSAPAVTDEDLAKIGIDPNQEGAEEKRQRTLPVNFAERIYLKEI